MSITTASLVLYNTPEDQLLRVIHCLANSTPKPIVYLVDNSPVPMNIRALEYPGVHYLRSKSNRGYGAGHNLAFRAIPNTAEFHFVLNPDIYFGPEELAKMTKFMKQHPGIGQLMPKVMYPDGSTQYLCKLLPNPVDLILRRFAPAPLQRISQTELDRFELRFTGYDQVMEVPNLSGCCMLFRVSALKEIGFFDEQFFMYLEDVDITRRMHEKYRTVYYPGAKIVHDHARASYKSWRALLLHMRSAARYFNKWGWIWDSHRSRINREILQKLEGADRVSESALAPTVTEAPRSFISR